MSRNTRALNWWSTGISVAVVRFIATCPLLIFARWNIPDSYSPCIAQPYICLPQLQKFGVPRSASAAVFMRTPNKTMGALFIAAFNSVHKNSYQSSNHSFVESIIIIVIIII